MSSAGGARELRPRRAILAVAALLALGVAALVMVVGRGGGSPDPPAEVGAALGMTGRPAPALPAPPPVPAVAAGAPERPLDRLRALASSDPRAALALARDLERSDPAGADAEERASLVIDALVRLGDIGEARTRAEELLARYPGGRFAAHVETLTGVHPRPGEPGGT
jgi:hypothetical protein